MPWPSTSSVLNGVFGRGRTLLTKGRFVDLDLLDEQRVRGTVIPLNDVIKDAYDRVLHYADGPEESNPDPA
jgi:hypothetical protein